MKKKIFLFALAAIGSLSLFSCSENKEESVKTYYVAVDGKSENDGSSEAPMNFSTAISKVAPGDTILLKAGKYESAARFTITNSGRPNEMITLKPETEDSRVIFDFSSMNFNGNNRGIQLNADFWNIENIEICGAGDNGLYISGSYNVIDNCQFYNNRDTGLQLGRASSEQTDISQWPSYNLIKNCTSFANYDDETFGENADGFAAKLTTGVGNIFDGCIAFRNSDDGWDLYAKSDSGNIGTVLIYNCIAFENGFLPYQIDRVNVDGSTYKSYDTLNGDGIGFKLGGSVMEGDVIVENCIAFNNKLHGVGDNSNPGVLSVSNTTAVNNCAGLNEDGTISKVRGLSNVNNNKSNNFDLARSISSYNNYYGLVSYINNQAEFQKIEENSYNQDAFRGSVGYSIFQTNYEDGEIYKAFEGYSDGSIYKEDYFFEHGSNYNGMSDSCFASLDSINALCEDVNHLSDLLSIHKKLRNADGSINFGDTCKIVDEKLLTFANGKPIGANLSKNSYEEYTHHDIYNFEDAKTVEDVKLRSVYTALDVMVDLNAVYQDFEIPKMMDGCSIDWESSNTDVLVIKNEETTSVSKTVTGYAGILPPSKDEKVTLKAIITCGDKSLEKTFELTVKPRKVSLGEIHNSGNSSIRVDIYNDYVLPNIYPIDASAQTKSRLDESLYEYKNTFRYAKDKNSNYYDVDNIYSSIPGVYEVTYTAISKIEGEEGKTSEYVYYVYVVDPNCNIDLIDNYEVLLIRDGVEITGELSNIEGDIYAVVSNENLSLTPEQLLEHNDVQRVSISNDLLCAQFNADNNKGEAYNVYFVISNKNKSIVSKVYSFSVGTQNVSTHQEFIELARTGKIGSAKDSPTIYNLTTDLDFSGDNAWSYQNPAESEGVLYTPSTFTHLFNGNNHTIKNIDITGSGSKIINLFYKVNGTIMNINFENIKIYNSDAASGKQVGIIGELQGGYVHNIRMHNVAAHGREGVGALIGQVSGKYNYVTQCSLDNDINDSGETEYVISAVNKYAAGLIGNAQMNSDQTTFGLYVSDCYVKANIGDGSDAAGNTGGIVGRVKNDSAVYSTVIERCYYRGTIIAKGQYNAGIVGDFDNGVGYVNIHHCLSEAVFIYDGEVLDAMKATMEGASQKYAHKNSNPIVGRAVLSTGIYETAYNYGSWAEYYSTSIKSDSIAFDLSGIDEEGNFTIYEFTEDKIKLRLGFDFENIWAYEEKGGLTFK